MKAIFVVGTGRSGTHFTIRLLAGFENAHDPLNGEEDERVLYPIARAAIHHRSYPQVAIDYYKTATAPGRKILLDQHHPNLFFMQTLREIVDRPVFLFPIRPTHQIVSSMLRHEGVLSWYAYARNWRQRTYNRIPYPNQFFGVDRYEAILDLPPHLLCAHRVIAHRKHFLRSADSIRDRLRSVDYGALVAAPLAEFQRIFTTTQLEALGRFNLREEPRPESLEKYKDNLTDAQVEEIMALEAQLLGEQRAPA